MRKVDKNRIFSFDFKYLVTIINQSTFKAELKNYQIIENFEALKTEFKETFMNIF